MVQTAAPAQPNRRVRELLADLEASEKAQAKFLGRARKIQKRYKQEQVYPQRKYALLYANTQTVLPAIYARPPEPVVSRRFDDADPTARAASQVLERALSYSIDKQDMDHTFGAVALDYALVARAVTWERYCPTYGPEEQTTVKVLQITTDAGVSYTDEAGGAYEGEVEDDGEGGFTGAGEPFRPVTYEESITDYVNVEDFGHTAGVRTWDEVDLVWRRAYMGRSALVERFGQEKGEKIPLDYKPPGHKDDADSDIGCKAAIFEMWVKSERRVYWVSKSWPDGVLDERNDPLGLDGFFPCPRPMFGVLANDNLMPTPDYLYYQDQAEEVDELTEKIAELQDALKVVGLYAADEKINFDNLMKQKTGALVPVPGWQSFREGGGVKGNVEWWPIENVVSALTACIELRKQLIEDVYQITGIADILRGATDPNETLGAQKLKANWGALRVRDRQKEVMRFARDVLRIKAEVIAETFSIETLAKMTGVQLPSAEEKAQAQQQAQMAAMQAQQTGQPPQVAPEVQELLTKPSWEDVKALLEDNAARQFRIDIETDSTIEPDEIAEKQQAVEFVTAVGNMIGQMLNAPPQLIPLGVEMLKFVVRKYRAGREFEDTIDRVAKELMSAPPGGGEAQPPPDRTPVEVAQIEQQTEQIKQQGELQRAEIGAQVKAQEIPLKQADQQLKLVAMQRDPQPQATA